MAAAACGVSRGGREVVAVERIDPGIAVATFDSLWKIVADTYVDTAFVSNRWNRVRDSLRPRAETAVFRHELDRLLAETLHTIPDSHFYIIPASVAPDDASSRAGDGRGSTGMVVRAVGDKGVVWRVLPGSAAEAAGIRPGQIVAKVGVREPAVGLRNVNSMPPQARPRALADLLQRLNGALTPRVGDTVAVVIASATGGRTHRLVAGPAEGRVSQYANLPPIAGVVKWSRVATEKGGCVGTIAFNIWLPEFAPDLERAVDSVRSCTGVVIDLRGNPGGLGAMVMRFGGYFVDSARSLGTMKMRQLSLNFVINPQWSRNDGSRMAPLNGPIAILTDPLTGSTSEIFATGMQRIGRAKVFGETSAGAALPALMDRLPSGDVFVHAVADFTDPHGKRIEGAGAVPDVVVPLSVEVLTEGRDGALDAAVSWIVQEAASRAR